MMWESARGENRDVRIHENDYDVRVSEREERRSLGRGGEVRVNMRGEIQHPRERREIEKQKSVWEERDREVEVVRGESMIEGRIPKSMREREETDWEERSNIHENGERLWYKSQYERRENVRLTFIVSELQSCVVGWVLYFYILAAGCILSSLVLFFGFTMSSCFHLYRIVEYVRPFGTMILHERQFCDIDLKVRSVLESIFDI